MQTKLNEIPENLPNSSEKRDFDDFFLKATGNKPYPYQKKLATDPELPDLIKIPTGAGKTAAVILAWLWRRRFAEEKIRKNTPRRLVYCLPMRVLVEQTKERCVTWLKNLGLYAETPGTNEPMEGGAKEKNVEDKKITVTVLMGGEDSDDWDIYPERDAIIIGTQDMLLSRALNRGYGMSRYRWPIHFGLLNNDCLWVMDEVQLMGNGLATSAQLESFRMGSCNPIKKTKTIWMSATMEKNWFETIDFKSQINELKELRLSDDDLQLLKNRLRATKTIEKLDVEYKKIEKIAKSIVNKHVNGSMTLVIVNRVDRAREIFKKIKEEIKKKSNEEGKEKKKVKNMGKKKQSSQFVSEQGVPETMLLHSHFRPIDKQKKIEQLQKAERILREKTQPNSEDSWQTSVKKNGVIVVSTQVVEAGIDISARTLITELPPFGSLVQRFGRCNRNGEYPDANVFWIELPTESKTRNKYTMPYKSGELEDSKKILTEYITKYNIKNVNPEEIENLIKKIHEENQSVDLFPYSPSHVIRIRDFRGLYSTEMDLSGGYTDISPFIRDNDVDLNVHVYWREIKGEPGENELAPSHNEICNVPFYELKELLGVKVWLGNGIMNMNDGTN